MKRERTEIKCSRTDRRQAVVCVTGRRINGAIQTICLILLLLILSGCGESGQAVQIGDGSLEAPGAQETDGAGKAETTIRREEGNAEATLLSPLPESGTGAKETASQIRVHVCGQVRYPGVYELEEGSRVWDAVQAAGGLTQEADAEGVNLARILEDGSKVTIPLYRVSGAGEAQSDDTPGNALPEDREDWYEAPSGAGEASGIHSAQDTSGRVDINRAGEAELVTIPGIGQTRAQAIVSYREEHGPFAAIEDIMQVTGIKEGLFAKIRDYISVGG